MNRYHIMNHKKSSSKAPTKAQLERQATIGRLVTRIIMVVVIAIVLFYGFSYLSSFISVEEQRINWKYVKSLLGVLFVHWSFYTAFDLVLFAIARAIGSFLHKHIR